MNPNYVDRIRGQNSYIYFSKQTPPVAKFIPISHSVSQSGDCKEANAVCSTQHLYQLATQYHIPVTVKKQLLSAAHNIYTN